jgi:hypothetical protein
MRSVEHTERAGVLPPRSVEVRGTWDAYPSGCRIPAVRGGRGPAKAIRPPLIMFDALRTPGWIRRSAASAGAGFDSFVLPGE